MAELMGKVKVDQWVVEQVAWLVEKLDTLMVALKVESKGI
jgi:hypothetical protein